MAIKNWRRDSVLIFILPPTLSELRRRLRLRQTETREDQENRLARALREIEYWTKYDYVVCNDKLDEAVELVSRIISAESQQSSRIAETDITF
jgi:guanylate kinase